MATPPFQPPAGSVQWLNDCIERSRAGIFSEVTTLTPGLAGQLLSRNDDNRNLRPAKVGQYAADIRSGRWTMNGEPLIISVDGQLNDGQHRAQAVVDANTPIQVLMVFGLPRETRTTIDQGTARTASDYLSMDGLPNATVQASIARVLIAYERNDLTALSSIALVTNSDVMERVHSDPEIAASAHFAAGRTGPARPYAPPAVIGFCHYIFNRISPAQADTYMDNVCRGEGLRARDPAYTVRDRLANLSSRSRERRIHIIIRGWNAYRQGRTLAIAKVMGEENIPAVI